MTEPRCPGREVLSAYVDREANPSEERRIDLHLADCGACRAIVRSLARLKTAVRAQPLPPLPAGLKASLLRMAREAEARARPGVKAWLLGRWRAALEAARQGGAALLERPALGAALAAAMAVLAVTGWRIRASRTVVPVDLILAAHNQYALTMPLAATEKIMSDLPVQISYGPEDDSTHVY